MDNESANNIIQLIQKKEEELREYLNYREKRKLKWLFPDDPIRIKNIEKIIGHLDRILTFLDFDDDGKSSAKRNTASLISLLGQINAPDKISTSNAWELADLLEIELIRLGDNTYLYTLLKAQLRSGRWEKNFPVADLDSLLKNYSLGESYHFEARNFLEHLQQQQVLEYRFDRAKAALRGKYLNIVYQILLVLLAILSYSFYTAVQTEAESSAEYLRNLLFVVLSAGALGSTLSRAVKLGRQPLHVETEGMASELPIDLAQTSWWKVFKAQPVIGASSALILFLIFYSGVMQIVDVGRLTPAHYGVIAFMAGFSETYFIGILDKFAGQTGGSVR